MRSAQSRLGLVTSLGAARRGMGRCVESLPVPFMALRAGTAAFAGIAGVALLRTLFTSRRKAVSAAATQAVAPPQNSMGRYLFSEAVLTLLLPLCRRFFLGENLPAGSSPGSIIDRLLRSGR